MHVCITLGEVGMQKIAYDVLTMYSGTLCRSVSRDICQLSIYQRCPSCFSFAVSRFNARIRHWRGET